MPGREERLRLTLRHLLDREADGDDDDDGDGDNAAPAATGPAGGSNGLRRSRSSLSWPKPCTAVPDPIN